MKDRRNNIVRFETFLEENSIDQVGKKLVTRSILEMREVSDGRSVVFWFVNAGHVAAWITQLEERGGGRRQSSDKFSRTLEPNRARQD